MNNKAFDSQANLESFHKCLPMAETEICKIKNWEKLKTKATNQSGSVQAMFEQETLNLAKSGNSIEEIANSMPQYEEKRSSMYRRKWKNYPKIPQDLKSLVFDNAKYTETVFSKRFLLVDCYEDDQRITIFSSENQLKMLCDSKKIGADGTFKSCPQLYSQLYILMAWFKGMCMPAAYILLGGKKKTHTFVCLQN